MLVSLYFDTKNLRSANFSRIVITILVYATIGYSAFRNTHTSHSYLRVIEGDVTLEVRSTKLSSISDTNRPPQNV